jgi:SAM-dependent methyltransferase
MKTRESGMPDEAVWDGFFDPPHIIEVLGVGGLIGDVVEFGCGYGTFTVAAARAAQGTVYALDVDPEMVRATREKAKMAGLNNVHVLLRDFVEDGTGRADESVAFAMLFNILHCEDPLLLLHEAHRVLAPGGSIGVIHWICDPDTPRGPSMEIRPRPEDCLCWLGEAGFSVGKGHTQFLPYHYGIVAQKPGRRDRRPE